jgi:hypothetical protein
MKLVAMTKATSAVSDLRKPIIILTRAIDAAAEIGGESDGGDESETVHGGLLPEVLPRTSGPEPSQPRLNPA